MKISLWFRIAPFALSVGRLKDVSKLIQTEVDANDCFGRPDGRTLSMDRLGKRLKQVAVIEVHALVAVAGIGSWRAEAPGS
jgi:hypothetical protein